MKCTENIAKIFLLIFFGFHLGLHILYLAPVNPATPTYSVFVNNYIGSFFSQNWHLFAPEPATSSLELAYRCEPDQTWSYPLRDLIQSHKQLPITAKGKMAYVLQNLVREIFNAKLLATPDQKIPELLILNRYIQNHCGRSSSAEVQVKRIFTKDYSKRFDPVDGETKIYNFRIERKDIVWNSFN